MPASKPLKKISVLLLAFGMLVGLVAGCGTTTSAPITGSFQDRGRQLFSAKCGTCHTMAQAATKGTQGPNLDDAFSAARAVGMDDATVKGVVKAQVENPRPMQPGFPGISMPANIVEGNDLDDVVAYVAKYAGVPGAKPPAAPGNGPGAQVFANNGCGACHTLAAAQSTGQTGPDFDKVLPGQSKAEIKQSIVDPEAKITKGYSAGIMPDRFGSIPPDQLNQLVEFLTTSVASDSKGK